MNRPESDEQKIQRLKLRQERLETERANWEPLFKDVDRLVSPGNDGGFTSISKGSQHGNQIFDVTAQIALDRYEAGRAALHFSRRKIWHGLSTTDESLNRDPAIRRWLEQVNDRLFAMRYASHAGFEPAIFADIRQDGSYGTAPLQVDEQRGYGMLYRSIHLSGVWFDEDYNGRINVLHRKCEKSAAQAVEMFSRPGDSLPDKVLKAANDPKRAADRFQFLYVIEPNRDQEPGMIGWRGMRYSATWLEPDEKHIVRKAGYRSFPVPTSRHSLSPGEKYGRSPALKVMGAIKTCNTMARDLLRAGNYNVLPPLLAHDDDDISAVQMIPGGITWGGMDERGNKMIAPLETGTKFPYAFEQLEMERKPIRDAFYEQFFELLLNPRDRMTATEVIEVAAKEADLLAPSAGRYEVEKIAPMVERELDIGFHARQLPPPPPAFLEASRAGQAGIKVVHQNLLAQMARLGEAAGYARWSEQLLAAAAFDPGVIDYMNFDTIAPDLANVHSVRSSWVASPDEVAAKRKAREDAQQLQQALAAIAGEKGGLADATLKFAKASETREGSGA